VARDGLLVSAGDGTAMALPVSWALVKAAFARVSSSERTVVYPDGLYLVPAVIRL
jgi:hypothetical protein